MSTPPPTPEPPVATPGLVSLLLITAVTFMAVGLMLIQSVNPQLGADLFGLSLLGSVTISGVLYRQRIINFLRRAWYAYRHRFEGDSHRLAHLSAVLMGLALVMMVLAGRWFRIATDLETPFTAAARNLMLGIVVVGAVLLLSPNPVWTPWPTTARPVRAAFIGGRKRWWLLFAVGMFALLLLAAVNGPSVSVPPSYSVQLLLLTAGILFIVWSLLGHDWCWPSFSSREILMLTAVLLLALTLRLIALETAIHHFVDEMHFIDAVGRLWEQPETPILRPFSSVTAFTWLYPLLQTGMVSLFGRNLLGMRILSALVGTFGVLAVYFLGRVLFHDRLLAFLAALLLATFPPHLHFSRLALNNIADPLFGTLALALLARGLQSARRSDFVLAGAALGLTQYFYEGGRLLFPVLLVSWFVLVWVFKRRDRHTLVCGLTGLMVAALVAAPLYYTLLSTESLLTPRLMNESINTTIWWRSLLASVALGGSEAVIWIRDRFVMPLLFFVSVRDDSWFYRGTQAIIIDPFVPLFLLGVAFAVWKWLSPAVWLLALWIMGTVIGNSLLVDTYWIPRYVVAFPAAVLLMAIGLRYGLRLLWPRYLKPVLAARVFVGVGLLVAAGQTAFYSGDQIPTFNQLPANHLDWEDAFFRMTALPPQTHVHIIVGAPVWVFNINAYVRFTGVNLTVDSVAPQQVIHEYLRVQTSAFDHAFFVDPRDTRTLSLLQKYFELTPPRFSPYSVARENQLGLYMARRK